MIAIVALLPAACGSRAASTAGAGLRTDAAVKLEVGRLSSLHTGALVDGSGYALYVFQPDDRRAVTCTGACALTWPPVRIPPGDRPSLGPGVQLRLVGSDPDGPHSSVVTYNGWPLYTYAADVRPGTATGQDLSLNGGLWYVMRPSGQPLTGTGLSTSSRVGP